VTLGLQNGINQVWVPYYLSLGGSLPSNLKTLVISYRYNCNANYQNCNDKEEYYVTQRYGLVQWIHYIRIPANGTYAQLQKTIFNKLVVGVVTRIFRAFEAASAVCGSRGRLSPRGSSSKLNARRTCASLPRKSARLAHGAPRSLTSQRGSFGITIP